MTRQKQKHPLEIRDWIFTLVLRNANSHYTSHINNRFAPWGSTMCYSSIFHMSLNTLCTEIHPTGLKERGKKKKRYYGFLIEKCKIYFYSISYFKYNDETGHSIDISDNQHELSA